MHAQSMLGFSPRGPTRRRDGSLRRAHPGDRQLLAKIDGFDQEIRGYNLRPTRLGNIPPVISGRGHPSSKSYFRTAQSGALSQTSSHAKSTRRSGAFLAPGKTGRLWLAGVLCLPLPAARLKFPGCRLPVLVSWNRRQPSLRWRRSAGPLGLPPGDAFVVSQRRRRPSIAAASGNAA